MLVRLWPFMLGSIALGLDAYVIAGLVPAISEDLGSSVALVGLGVTMFTAAYAISGPVFAGRAGRSPYKALVVTLAIFMVGNLFTMIAPHILLFLFSRIVAGFAAGIYSPLATAIAAEMVRPEQRGRALSYVLSGLALGSVVGVPVGLFIAEHFDWRVTIMLIIALGGLSLLGTWLNKSPEIPVIDAPNLRSRLGALTEKKTLTTILVTLFTGIGSLGLYTYIQPLLSKTSLSSQMTLAIWVWGLGGAVAVFAIGRVIDKSKSSLRITAGITLMLMLAMLGIGAIDEAAVLIPLLFVWGGLGWCSLAPQQHTLLNSAPDNDGATVVAANSSANYLGSSIGSAMGAGVVAVGISGQGLAFLAAVPLLIAFLLQILRLKLA